MKRCTRCVLPETYPNIKFDNDGVCNFCLSHKTPHSLGEEALVKRINKLRCQSCDYDAIIALSGGRDSTYTTYYITKILGYKPIAVTIDNGMMPETTWKNIKNTVEILNIDHMVIKSTKLRNTARHVLKAFSQKPTPAMVSFLCSGCNAGLKDGYQKAVDDLKCPLIIKGGGEPEQPFAEYLLSGSDKRNRFHLIQGYIKEIIKNPRYLKPSIQYYFIREFIARFIKSNLNYKSLYFYNYIDWDEEKIVSTIMREFGWQIPPKVNSSWRADCKINIIKNYYYNNILGFTKNDELLSQLIRNNVLTRDEAIQRLLNENQTDIGLLKEIFNELDAPLKF